MTARARELAEQPDGAVASDTLALKGVAAGDLGALAELYDRHAVALLRFAHRAVGPADAEDLLQALFVRTIKIAGTYDGRKDSARAWLLGVMARLIQERRRSLTRYARALLQLSENRHLPAPGEHLSDLETGLSKLPDAKRVVLILSEIEGYTCDEIARMLEIPTGTVWTRLHHARKLMRDYYERGEP